MLRALERDGLPEVPPGGPIWQRFPVPTRLSHELAREFYVDCGLGLTHVELLTGQPAESVRRLLKAASPWRRRECLPRQTALPAAAMRRLQRRASRAWRAGRPGGAPVMNQRRSGP